MKIKPTYIAIILLFVLSCKTKHKIVKSTSESTSTVAIKSDSISIVKSDSTKTVTETKTETKKTGTIELTFDLDKNRLTGDSALFNNKDTNGNGLLGLLINKALRNATTLKIRIEQSLEHNQEKKETTQKNVKKTTSTSHKEATLQNTEKKTKVVEKKKDSTPKFNSVIIVGAVLAFIFLLLKFIWPFIRNYFKFFLI